MDITKFLDGKQYNLILRLNNDTSKVDKQPFFNCLSKVLFFYEPKQEVVREYFDETQEIRFENGKFVSFDIHANTKEGLRFIRVGMAYNIGFTPKDDFDKTRSEFYALGIDVDSNTIYCNCNGKVSAAYYVGESGVERMDNKKMDIFGNIMFEAEQEK